MNAWERLINLDQSKMQDPKNTYLGQKYPGTTNEKKKTIFDMLDNRKAFGMLPLGSYTPSGTSSFPSPAPENKPIAKYQIPTVSNTKYSPAKKIAAIAISPGEMRPVTNVALPIGQAVVPEMQRITQNNATNLKATGNLRLTTVPQGNSPRLTSTNPNAERNILLKVDPKTFFTKEFGAKDYAVKPVSAVPQRKSFKGFKGSPVPGVEAALRQDKEGLGRGIMTSRPGQLSSIRSSKGIQVERQISPDKKAVNITKDAGKSLPTSKTPVKDAKNILREYMTGMQYDTDVRPETKKQLLAGDLQIDPETQQPFTQNPVKGKRIGQRFDNPTWGTAVGGINPDSSIDMLAKTGDQSYEVRRIYGSETVGTKLNDPDPRFESARYKEVRAGEAVGDAMNAGKTELIGSERLNSMQGKGLVRKPTEVDIQELGQYKARGLVGFMKGAKREGGGFDKIPLYSTTFKGTNSKGQPEKVYRIGVAGPRDWNKTRSLIADVRAENPDVTRSALTTQVTTDSRTGKRIETGLAPFLNREDVYGKIAGIRKNYENPGSKPVPENRFRSTEAQIARSLPEAIQELQAGHYVDNKFPMTSQHSLVESYRRVLASAAATGAMVGAPEEIVNLMKAADPSRATEVDMFKSPYAYDKTLPRDQQGPTPFTNAKRGESVEIARAILSKSPDQLDLNDIAILDEITRRVEGKPLDVDALGYEDVGMNEGGRKGFRVEDVEGVRARMKDSALYYQDWDDVVRPIPQRPVSDESLIGGKTIFNTGRIPAQAAALRARYNADPRVALGQEAHNDSRVLQAGVDGASLNAPAKQTAPVPYMDYRNVAAALGAGNEGNISDAAFLKQRRAEAIIAQRIAARNRMRA